MTAAVFGATFKFERDAAIRKVLFAPYNATVIIEARDLRPRAGQAGLAVAAHGLHAARFARTAPLTYEIQSPSRVIA